MASGFLSTLGRALGRAEGKDEAARLIVKACQELKGVQAAFCMRAPDPGALSLRWICGEGIESSLGLERRVEEALRAGVVPQSDPRLLAGAEGEPSLTVFVSSERRALGRPRALIGLLLEPDAAPELALVALSGARDLLALSLSLPDPEPPEEPAGDDHRSYRFRREEIFTRSPAMERIFSKLDRVVGLDVPVLIMGETGTGKELIARSVHRSSKRRKRRFYAQNCGAISAGLLESELFGYTRGAFTGADRDRKGLFEVASGSTLFLDEVGEMDLEMQKKLLRVLQEKEVLPVGSTEPRPVDVRIVCATNRGLKEEVAAGRFREDLYYRLQVIQLVLPPLRERLDDLPMLIDFFLGKLARKRKEPRKILDRRDPRALDVFFKHTWPGNIRELENVVTRLAHFSGEVITYEILKDDQQLMAELELPDDELRPVFPLSKTLAKLELAEIENALRVAKGNRTHAADLLRVNRRSLLRRLTKYGLNAGS